MGAIAYSTVDQHSGQRSEQFTADDAQEQADNPTIVVAGGSPSLLPADRLSKDSDQESSSGLPSGLRLAHCQLAEFNLQFLDLVAGAEWSDSAAFPDFVREQLRTLPSAAKHNMSRCPFALFSLPLQDAVSRIDHHLERTAASGPQAGNAQSQWAVALVFFAWHLAHTSPLALKYFVGVDDRTANTLRQMSIASLAQVAERVAGRVSVRWAQHPLFWPNLVRFARLSEQRGLQMTALLGRQLLATEALRFCQTRLPDALPQVTARTAVEATPLDSIAVQRLRFQHRSAPWRAMQRYPSADISRGA